MEFKRYWIGYTVVIAFAALYWVATPRPEQPHKVYVEGKAYIRSREYVGAGKYQVIMLPVSDSTNCPCK